MNLDCFTNFLSGERINMFKGQYNNREIDQLNNLMGQIQQSFHPQQQKPDLQQPPQKQITVADKLRAQAQQQQQQSVNNKLTSYNNSRDKYEHDKHKHTQYVNPQMNNNFNGLDAYQHSLNDDNMFPKDLRENINNKMDTRIFESVSDNRLPLISQISDDHNIILNHKPHIEHRSKNLYKQQTNERLNEYSPLARSAFIPSLNSDSSGDRKAQMRKVSPRDMMNQRLDNFKPLSCNISLKKPNNDNKNIRTAPNYEKSIIEQNAKYQQAMNDINHIDSGSCNNVVNNNMPVSTTY